MTSSMQIGKENVEIPITDTVEMSQYQPILIIDPIIGATLMTCVRILGNDYPQFGNNCKTV